MTRTVALMLMAGALAAPVHAQPEGTVVRLTLDEAIRRGLATSHRVAELSARREAADAVVEQRKADARPALEASGGYMRTNHVDEFGIVMPSGVARIIYPDIPDNVRSRVGGQWLVHDGGRFTALESSARLEEQALGDDTAALRNDLRLEITRAFWALIVARESMRVVNDSLDRLRVHVRDVRNRLDAGLVPPNDVLTAEAQEARQRMLSIRAATASEIAEAELARLVGLPAGQRIEPDAALTQPSLNDERVEALVARAQANRSERQALGRRIQALGERQEAALAARRPTIGIVAGFDFANPNPRIFPRQNDWATSWDAGVNVNWPIFDGGRAKAGAAEAAASARALQARVSEFDSTLSLEVRQQLLEIEASRASIEAAETGLRAATEAERVVGERFAAGVATNTDLLDAQSDVLRANLERTEALASARMAEARLRRALGQ